MLEEKHKSHWTTMSCSACKPFTASCKISEKFCLGPREKQMLRSWKFWGCDSIFLTSLPFWFHMFSCWWFQPLWKICSSRSFPQGLGWTSKIYELPPPMVFVVVNSHQIPCLICFKPRHHALPTVTERSLIEVERLRTNRGWDFQIPAVSFR